VNQFNDLEVSPRSSPFASRESCRDRRSNPVDECDGHTEGQTDRQNYDHKYRATYSVAPSHGKNGYDNVA